MPPALNFSQAKAPLGLAHRWSTAPDLFLLSFLCHLHSASGRQASEGEAGRRVSPLGTSRHHTRGHLRTRQNAKQSGVRATCRRAGRCSGRYCLLCFASRDLRPKTRPLSSRFMATCPGESINYYLYGSSNPCQRQGKTPRWAAPSPGGLGAMEGLGGAGLQKACRPLGELCWFPRPPPACPHSVWGSIILLL